MGAITLQWRDLVDAARKGRTEGERPDGIRWMLWQDPMKTAFVSAPELLAHIDRARRLLKTNTPFLLIGPQGTGKNVFLNLVARGTPGSGGVDCVDENVGVNENEEVKRFFGEGGVVAQHPSALLHFDFMENAVCWDRFIQKLHKLAILKVREREDGQHVACPAITVVFGAHGDLDRVLPKKDCLIKFVYGTLKAYLPARTRRLSEQVDRLPTILEEMLAAFVIRREFDESEVAEIEKMPLSVLDRLKKSPLQDEFLGLLGIVRAAAECGECGWEKAIKDLPLPRPTPPPVTGIRVLGENPELRVLQAEAKTLDKTDKTAVARLAVRAVAIAARPPYAVTAQRGADPVQLDLLLSKLLPHVSPYLSVRCNENRRHAQDGRDYALHLGWLVMVATDDRELCVVTDKGRQALLAPPAPADTMRTPAETELRAFSRTYNRARNGRLRVLNNQLWEEIAVLYPNDTGGAAMQDHLYELVWQHYHVTKAELDKLEAEAGIRQGLRAVAMEKKARATSALSTCLGNGRRKVGKRKKRTRIPNDVETEVLTASKRRCCLCFGLDHDSSQKRGQIAHLDDDPSNNKLDNLAWLCQLHHDEYDAKHRQTKNITPAEVKKYRRALCRAMQKRFPAAPPIPNPKH